MAYRLIAVAIALTSSLTVGARTEEPQSTHLATELDSLLTARGMDAIAAADPESPTRFVAALSYPKSQLLVVDAAYPAPALMREEIVDAKYRDAYLALQQAGSPVGKLFFVDLGYDGLRDDAEADVLYSGPTKQLVFDGRPEKHQMTKKAYETEFATAEATYSRLLTVLINQLKHTGTR
jgi:hypothetical protein